MSNLETEDQLHNPPRTLGVPNLPIPQTNLGYLEASGIPITQPELITDIPLSFSWMVGQWKYIDQFKISTSQAPGQKLYTTTVVANSSIEAKHPNWMFVPFSNSVWWNGTVSYRFTAIKPPRVAGKLLVIYRQDCFGSYKATDKLADISVKDTRQRSILKEWDLSTSSQFEFNITGSFPIRARPCKYPIYIGANLTNSEAISQSFRPWIEYEMGRILIENAQYIVPGSIFPSEYTIMVEKCFKNVQFYTPTDSRSVYRLSNQYGYALPPS